MMKSVITFLKSRTFLYTVFTLIAIPFVLELLNQPWGHREYEHFMHETGEWAARFLVITLLISPLRILFPKTRVLKWFHRHKRAFGIYTFIFSAIHLLAYLVEHTSLSRIISDLSHEPSVLFGWIAFLIFLPLALTSNDFSIRLMKGKNWKNVQRLVYVAAMMVAVHWLWGEHHLNWGPVLVHFLPLFLLELHRIYHYLKKPKQHQLVFG